MLLIPGAHEQSKDTAIAASTCCMMSSSTRPIFSRRRFLSKVRICSSKMMESRGRPLLWPGSSMCVGSFGLTGAGGNSRRDDGWAVAVAGVVLHDQHRAHAPLLAAYHRAQVGIINFPRLTVDSTRFTLRRKKVPMSGSLSLSHAAAKIIRPTAKTVLCPSQTSLCRRESYGAVRTAAAAPAPSLFRFRYTHGERAC